MPLPDHKKKTKIVVRQKKIDKQEAVGLVGKIIKFLLFRQIMKSFEK
jgi:hypothetical protein